MDPEKKNDCTIISEDNIEQLCKDIPKRRNFTGKRVLALIPDSTRSGPTGTIFAGICNALLPIVKELDFMIALGTHPIMPEEKVNSLLNITEEDRKTRFSKVRIFQHEWDKEEALAHIGTITDEEISDISGGLLHENIRVTLNKKALEYDELLLVGPVFPHEVVGYSGGYKYLFPGISGPEFLHKFHWLGALITNPKINGTKNTPVRATINKAVSFLPTPTTLVCYVVQGKNLCGFFTGGIEAWSSAADLSSQLNVKYVPRPFSTVLSMAPEMYDDIWTAGKCMYKLEPVVADNGTLIIYAPHVTEVSYTHGKALEKIGYHTRDYFAKQLDKFPDLPGGTMAHSTHVKGIGTFHHGIETPRVNVILATGISEERCRNINLGYMDWKSIKPEEYEGREEEGILCVHNAGEVLYRLSDGTVPDIDELYKKL
jgi:nickel-dependent lactate racemase